ncbi:MAG: hypothetical protein ACRBCJ_04475 [Hyphomicrobiaceae bacterium]
MKHLRSLQAEIRLMACCALMVGFITPLAKAEEQTTPTPADKADVDINGEAFKEKFKSDPNPNRSQELLFAPGTTLKLACQTEGIGVGHAPPKTTRGRVELELTISDTGDKPGQWRVTSIESQHKEAFAAYLKSNNMCGDGCLLRLSKKFGAELWAPKPMPIDKLNKGEMLVLITINEKTRELKSSTFQGVDDGSAPLVFEKGTCEKIQ